MVELKDKVLKNKEKFLETNEKYGVLSVELLKYLGEDLFTAPASNMESMYNATPGGLVDYILTVTKYGINLNSILPTKLQVDVETIIKVCFLHQIGKTYLFNFCTSEWHRNNLGKNYEYNEELISMRVSERSIYYCMDNNVKLTEEEYQAIINYDKGDDDKQSKWYGTILSSLLKQANDLAIIECKNIKNG
jgi:hypothetical protein